MEEKEVYKKLFIATLGAMAFVFALEVMPFEDIYSWGSMLLLLYMAELLFVAKNEISRQTKLSLYSILWAVTFVAVLKLNGGIKPMIVVSFSIFLPWLLEYRERRKLKKEGTVLDDQGK